jgi:hypothetical protein
MARGNQAQITRPRFASCAIDGCEVEADDGCATCEKALCTLHVGWHYCRPAMEKYEPSPGVKRADWVVWITKMVWLVGMYVAHQAWGFGSAWMAFILLPVPPPSLAMDAVHSVRGRRRRMTPEPR